jgi:drug/metabolite transporter (DMT)-like permease
MTADNRELTATAQAFKSGSLAPHLALVAVQLMFGTWPILGKVVLRVIPSSGLVALRVCGAAIAFLLLQRRLGQLCRLPRKDFASLLLCTLLGVVINQFLFVKGLSLTTVINATLLGTTIPVFTLAISIVLGHDSASLRRLLGILLAGSGVVYLVNPFRSNFSSQTTVGDLLIVSTSFLYGAYIAISKNLFNRYGALNVITWIFLLASVFTVPIGGLVLQGEALKAAGPTVWLSVLYIIIVPTVAAYYLNAWALTRVTPGTVAIYIYLQPLIVFGLAPLLLGESWNRRTLMASLLIFSGVGIVTKRGRSRAAREVAQHPDALAH